MTSTHSSTPEADRAAEIFHSLERQREATVAVPGTQNSRLLARLVDGAVAGVGAYLVVSAFTQATRSDQALASTPGDIHIAWGPSALNLLFFGTLVLAVAMVAVYEVLWTAWRGATFGKNRTQLQVVDATNFEPAVPVRLLLRTMLWATPFTFAMLTWFYSVLFAWGALALLAGMYCWRLREDSGGRPLWDVLAGTHVITTDFDRPDRP